MPYITQKQRQQLDPEINKLLVRLKTITGEAIQHIDGPANYAITRIVDDLFGHPPYDRLVRGVGLLDAASKEFYRRRVAPYEDKKIAENGDVY